MSYIPTTLVARRTYSPEPVGFLDAIKEFGAKALSFYGQTQQAKGQASAYEQMLAAQAAQRAQTPAWIAPVAVGGAVVAAILLLRRRKTA